MDTLWLVKQSSHLLSFLLHSADTAAASSQPLPTRLAAPSMHVQLMIPDDEGVFDLRPPTYEELARVT